MDRARFAKGARAAVMGAMFILCIPAAHAQPQPPSERCRPASKLEYDSAKQQFLLQNRFGMYVRTGRVWRRHYWYCRL